MPKRFEAYGWHTITVEDGNDLDAIEAALRAGMAEEERPTLITLKTVIGFASPRAGTRNAHSDPMPDEMVRQTKEALGWDPDAQFLIPDGVYEHWRDPVHERGAAAQAEWEARVEAWAVANPELAADWNNAQAGRPKAGFADALKIFKRRGRQDLDAQGRGAGDAVVRPVRADDDRRRRRPLPLDLHRVRGRREVHARARRPQRGLGRARARHGRRGQRPRAARRDRQAVLLDLFRVHRLHAPADQALGADEARLRVDLQPRLGRGGRGRPDPPAGRAPRRDARDPEPHGDPPADATEATEAWALTLESHGGPICLVFSRQDVPILDRNALAPASGLRKGAYVLAEVDSPDVVLVATGAEVSTALGARDLLAEKGVQVRVVSMPSWELFEQQSAEYRDEVLPRGVPKISVEAGSTFGWARWVDASIGIDRFGASGKGDKVLAHFGISPEAVATRVEETIAELAVS